MGCCFLGKDKDKTVSDSPQRVKKCQDIIWLILFVAATYGSYHMALKAKKLHKPIYTNGVDSWGNICGYDGNQNQHSYTSVVEGQHNGYPEANVDSMAYIPTFYMQNHKENTKIYASEFTFSGSPAMVCLKQCPGVKLTDAIKNIYDDDTKMGKLAGIVAAQPASKNEFNAMVAVAFGADHVTLFQNELWCEDVVTAAGYDTSKGDICNNNIGHTVLTPSSTLLNRCTPHYKLALRVASLATASSPEVPTNKTVVGKITDMINEGSSAIVVYKRQILYSFLGSVIVALIVIFLIQVLTKYIIITVVVLFAITSIAAMGFTLFRLKQIDDPTWGVDCSQSSPAPNEAVMMFYQDTKQQLYLNSLNSFEEPSFASIEGTLDEGAERVQERLLGLCSGNNTVLTDAERVKARNVAQYTMIGVWAVAGLMLLTICCCWSNIYLAVTLFDEAGQCVFAIPGILIQPIWTLIITGLTLMALLWKFMYVTQVVVPMKDAENDGQVTWEASSLLWDYWWIYTFFITVWVLVFVDGCHQVSLAGAVSDWFWKHGDEVVEDGFLDRCSLCPARQAMLDMIKFNLGSIALGSLLIAIVRTIQVIVWLIQRTAKQSAGGKEPSKATKAILCCVQCCLKFIEKFLEFVNRNAFIGIAIFGYSFCRAAQKAIALKVENAGRAVIMVAICSMVLFLGKIVSVLGSMLIFKKALEKSVDTKDMDLNSQVGVYACVGLFAWWITGIFLSVYGMALDTIFLCFCEDQQRNNGRDRPYKSSMQLQKFMRENA